MLMIHEFFFRDEEMEYFVEVEEEECYEPSKIDFEYEFDAARFFDFSKSETPSEVLEAELWFEVSGNYPSSPVIVKSKWRSGISSEAEHKTTGTLRHSSMSSEAKSKSTPKLSKQRSSTLMKPTASHLAKLKHAQKVYSTQFCERSLKAVNKSDEQSLQSCSGFDNLATKRQKLEIGYLCKVAQLKHQSLLLHKLSKKGGCPVATNSVNSKLKVTIPKQPELKTLHRAQMRRSKSGFLSSEHEKQKNDTIKARPLNKKIPEACLKPQPKKSKQKLPNCREFHLKTMERAMQHSPDNVSSHHTANPIVKNTAIYSKRPKVPSPVKHSPAKQEKSERSPQTKSGLSNRKLSYGEHHAVVCQITTTREATIIHRKSKSSTNLRLLQHPPTELFNKMSLVPGTGTSAISQPKLRISGKDMKENAADPFRHEYSRSVGKPYHNGVGRATSKIGCHPSINRTHGRTPQCLTTSKRSKTANIRDKKLKGESGDGQQKVGNSLSISEEQENVILLSLYATFNSRSLLPGIVSVHETLKCRDPDPDPCCS